MEKLRTKTMRVKIPCALMNKEYFENNYREYYEFLSCDIAESKTYGFYVKNFYKLKCPPLIIPSTFDLELHANLPIFICTSKIY